MSIIFKSSLMKNLVCVKPENLYFKINKKQTIKLFKQVNLGWFFVHESLYFTKRIEQW